MSKISPAKEARARDYIAKFPSYSDRRLAEMSNLSRPTIKRLREKYGAKFAEEFDPQLGGVHAMPGESTVYESLLRVFLGEADRTTDDVVRFLESKTDAERAGYSRAVAKKLALDIAPRLLPDWPIEEEAERRRLEYVQAAPKKPHANAPEAEWTSYRAALLEVRERLGITGEPVQAATQAPSIDTGARSVADVFEAVGIVSAADAIEPVREVEPDRSVTMPEEGNELHTWSRVNDAVNK